MRVLVTGGAGFIGSQVVDLLLAEGADVTVLDRLDPDRAGHIDQRVELIRGELGDPQVARAAVQGVDAVCHQAARVGLGVDFGDVGGYVADNDLATAALLKALWEREFRGRLVLASSMVIYGAGRAKCAEHGMVIPAERTAEDLAGGRYEPRCPHTGCNSLPSWAPVDEDSAAMPRSIYAATKLHQEHLCSVWGRESGAEVVALRYHNVYGPRMPLDTPYAGVAAIFRSALLAGTAPQVLEDGGQTRDFVHVRDVARANVLALSAAGQVGGAYNIASGTPHTVADLAEALAAALGGGAHPPQITGRWRTGDVRHIVASHRRAAERLAFTARVGFQEGMAEFAHAPVPAITIS